MRILVVDDDSQFVSLLQTFFCECGYAVDAAITGSQAEYLAQSLPYDLITLDTMLPDKNGLEICKSLRDKKIRTPILMITAKDDLDDLVRGLDNGADDYVAKPFELAELEARVRALLRRGRLP